MCLILDVQIVHKVFPDADAEYVPVKDALMKGKAKCAYGGHLSREYQRMPAFRRLLRALDQRGAAFQVPDAAVDAETKRIEAEGRCRSDDPHILALAIVSRVRLLCSEDEDLGQDFTDPSIISRPRGRVYKRAEHAHLIRECCENGR